MEKVKPGQAGPGLRYYLCFENRKTHTKIAISYLTVVRSPARLFIFTSVRATLYGLCGELEVEC